MDEKKNEKLKKNKISKFYNTMWISSATINVLDCSRYFDLYRRKESQYLNYWAYRATNKRMESVKHKIAVLSGKGGWKIHR